MIIMCDAASSCVVVHQAGRLGGWAAKKWHAIHNFQGAFTPRIVVWERLGMDLGLAKQQCMASLLSSW